MRLPIPALLAGLSLLAGCAAPRPAPQPEIARQGVAYMAKVVSVRQVSGGQALPQVMQLLGQPITAADVGAQEIIVQLPDGSVKSLVPPPGTAPAGLAPGSRVEITEAPQLRMIAR